MNKSQVEWIQSTLNNSVKIFTFTVYMSGIIIVFLKKVKH